MTTTPEASTSTRQSDNYCQDYLPSEVLERLEAGAFRRLCEHLRHRSDAVQNIDLMTVGGFCRNCLAKVREMNCIYFPFVDCEAPR